MIQAPLFDDLDWLVHGFGLRDSQYPEVVRLPRQTHSKIVLDIAECSAEREGDAVISALPGTVVGVKTADCVPILLADPVTRTVAAVHAGWRGTAENIVGATVRKMAERWGVRPEDIRAAIGPSIGVCCYEVGPEVAFRFGIDCIETVQLDLPKENTRQLRELGVREVWVAGECTYCGAARFHSFRRDRERAGRMISFIGRMA